MSVFCPCREPGPLGPEKLPTLLDHDECYFGLNRLLYCPQCAAIRCPFCTNKEPVTWFCSACLMETTKQAARAAGNRCMRNCLRCPRCQANAILKPDEKDGLLGVECAAAGCGWVYDGMLRKPMKDTQPLSVAQQVRLLDEQSFLEVLAKVKMRFPDKRESPGGVEAIPPAQRVSYEPVNTDSELPALVPLRAKTLKRCRACDTCLSEPVRQPAQASFTTKWLARSVLPAVEAYRDKNVIKVVLRNFGTAVMDVRLASPDSDTAIFTPDVKIPPLGASGFFAPLFLVERETTASRQAYMAGADANSGRGWAICELEAPPQRSVLHLFTSVGRDAPIGAWLKVHITKLN